MGHNRDPPDSGLRGMGQEVRDLQQLVVILDPDHAVLGKMASYRASSPVSAAVCDCAALAPSSERPILITTIGLPRSAASFATSRNLSARLKPSTNPAMTRVSGSSSK